ncbi:MAG: DNA replication/repair protein RecF [Clostridia bacterium]|nr:DNA replication/repair protein RecF [Clostridia bacterium]
MNVLSLSMEGFRNIDTLSFCPGDGVNVLYGDNAQGKTNILEAIWLFTGGKSFRGAKDAELVGFGRDSAKLTMRFDAAGRQQQATITIAARRSAVLNGLPLPAVTKLTGRFCAVIFSPEHLALIKAGPEERRKFLDAACCQLRPAFMPVLAEYLKTLKQRNRLIKAIRAGDQPDDPLLFDTFDRQLASSGAAVRRERRAYLEKLGDRAAAIYDGLSAGRERLALAYETGRDTADALYNALQASRQIDQRAGFTTIGPHRDDFDVTINGSDARRFGSQGQQRSCVLALKLAEAALLQDACGEQPVVLLDDVMSELDASRQDFLLNQMTGWQTFITCCDPAMKDRLHAGFSAKIVRGSMEERTL